MSARESGDALCFKVDSKDTAIVDTDRLLAELEPEKRLLRRYRYDYRKAKRGVNHGSCAKFLLVMQRSVGRQWSSGERER